MRKILSIVLAICLIAALFAACSKSPSPSPTPTPTPTPSQAASTASETPSTEPTPEDPFPNKTLKVAAFQGGYGVDYWNEMVAAFEAAYPGVTVELNISPDIGNILAPQIAGGNVPDFIYLNDTEKSGLVASLVKNRELLDITDVFDGPALDNEGVTLRELIIPGMLESTKYQPYQDGKIYLAPFNCGPMGLVYNKKLFADKGWKLPQTWDDFFALNEELKKPENYVTIDGKAQQRYMFTYQGIYPGYLESLLWPSIAGAGGLEATQNIGTYKEGSFTTPDVLSIIEIMAKIGTQGFMMPGTTALNHTQSQTDMMLGKALFIPNGNWMEGEMADSPREDGFEFGLLATPTVKAGQPNYVLSSYEQFEIPAKAANPELAKEFLRFLYTKPSVEAFAKAANGTYALTDAKETAKPFLTSGVYGMFSAYDTGTFMLMNFDALPENTKVSLSAAVFDENMTPLMTGQMSPQDYCQKMESVMKQIREDMKAAG